MNTELNTYKKNNHYSQIGEDGILEEIFKRIGVGKGYAVEFGAGDGKTIANSYFFINDKQWGGLLIESDSKKFFQLEQNMASREGVSLHNGLVSHEGPNCLDEIFNSYSVDKNFDLLSIDIDGSDYVVWEALESYTPKCVIIEYATCFPPHVEFVEKPNQHLGFGNSARSLVKLGEKKGYVAVASTPCNLIFIQESLFSKLNTVRPSLEDLTHYDYISYVISKPGAKLFLSRKRPMHFMFPGEGREGKPPDSNGFWPIHIMRR